MSDHFSKSLEPTLITLCSRYYMLVPSAEWTSKLQSMQLKDLCNAILSKTIPDTDKFQSGLTKIFFRAGMLAQLESMRSDRLNQMVTVVQKNVRRMLAHKKYKTMRAAAIKIQTWWRGILARRLVLQIRRSAAAQRLQRASRMFIQRKKFLDCRRSIILVQSRQLFDIHYHTAISCQENRYSRSSGPRGLP